MESGEAGLVLTHLLIFFQSKLFSPLYRECPGRISFVLNKNKGNKEKNLTKKKKKIYRPSPMFSFYRWENQVPETLSNMSKVTQNPSRNKNRKLRIFLPRPTFWSMLLPTYPLASPLLSPQPGF